MNSPEWKFYGAMMGYGVWKQQIRISLKIERRWPYYALKMVLVLGLLSLVACSSSFVDSTNVDGNLGFLSACLLASIAYLYVAGDAIPKLPFLTLMDKYNFSQILLISLLVI